jgi:hypothetical protein
VLATTLREPPRWRSPRASVLQFYFLKKEEIEFKKELALAQLQIDQKQGTERFEEYRKEAFPWIEAAKKRVDSYHAQKLVEAIKAGPLAIRPLGGMRVHSRTARRVRSAEEARSPAPGGFRRIG